MEITYKNKSYALGKKDRNIEGEAPAVRVKMLDNETKVIGLMAPSVQVMITLNDINKYNSVVWFNNPIFTNAIFFIYLKFVFHLFLL